MAYNDSLRGWRNAPTEELVDFNGRDSRSQHGKTSQMNPEKSTASRQYNDLTSQNDSGRNMASTWGESTKAKGAKLKHGRAIEELTMTMLVHLIKHKQ